MHISVVFIPHYLDHLAVMNLVMLCDFGFAATILAHVLDLKLQDMETLIDSKDFSRYATFHGLLVHGLIPQVAMMLLSSLFGLFQCIVCVVGSIAVVITLGFYWNSFIQRLNIEVSITFTIYRHCWSSCAGNIVRFDLPLN